MKPENEPEAETVSISRPLAPTMSKAALLIRCQYPWRRQIPVAPATEPMNYGSAFHAAVANLLEPTSSDHRALPLFPKPFDKRFREEKRRPQAATYTQTRAEKYGVDPQELHTHVKRAWAVLYAWIRGDNPWNVDLSGARRRVEISLAYNVKTGEGRRIDAPDKDHVYHDAGKFDLPGTADLVLDMIPEKARRKGAPHFIVLDHKTGEEFDPPLESTQLLSLGLAYRGIVPYEKREIALAVFHTARSDSPPTVYADEVESNMLDTHAARLKKAYRRIGDGSLTPGPHCQRCPAITTCPAYENALVALKPNGALTSAQVGKIHQALAVYNSFAKKISEEIVRPWVRQHGPTPRPDGKLVVLTPHKEERVAKKYVIEKEGEEAAEAVFEEWREKGYLQTSESERLVAVWDK